MIQRETTCSILGQERRRNFPSRVLASHDCTRMAAAVLLLMTPRRRLTLVADVDHPGEYMIVDRDSDTEYGPFNSHRDPKVVARTISTQLNCQVVIESKQGDDCWALDSTQDGDKD